MDRIQGLLNAIRMGFSTEKLLAELLALSKSRDYQINKSSEFLAQLFHTIGKKAVDIGAAKLAEDALACAIVFYGSGGDGRIVNTLGLAECLLDQLKVEVKLGNIDLAVLCVRDLSKIALESEQVLLYLISNDSWKEYKYKLSLLMDTKLAELRNQRMILEARTPL